MNKQPLIPLTTLLWGLQFSFLSPALALILVALYGATPAEVGLVLAIYNAGGFVAALLIPTWADRHGTYLRVLLACALLTVALAVVLALASELVVATVALVALGGPAGVGTPMLFAHLKHSGAPPRQVVNTRAVFSLAWVAGPPIATALMGAFGARAALVAIAVIGVFSSLLAFVMLRRNPPEATRTDQPPAPADVDAGADAGAVPVPSTARVAVIVVAFVLAQATNAAAVAVMTLFVTEHLRLPLVWAGVALGLAAALEIPALLLLGRLGVRRSRLGLLVTGCLAGAVYYVGMAFIADPVGLLALQVPNAWFFASISGIGLTVFQDLIPRPGIATGIYTNTRRVGSIIAGPVIALASGPWGYSGLFIACAAMAASAALATGLVARPARTPRAAARSHPPAPDTP